MRTSGLIAALVSLVLGFSAVGEAATCVCSIRARMGPLPEIEVCNETATCTQFFNTLPPGCRAYCQALFDSTKSTCATHYPNACQNIYLRAFAKCGTASFQQVDSETINVGGTFVCPPGQWLHSDGVSCVTGTPCGLLPNAANQSLSSSNNAAYPRYFVWQNNLFKITGPAVCQH